MIFTSLRHFDSFYRHKKKCQACGVNRKHKDEPQTEKSKNSLQSKRTECLRTLLGLKPEDKNVLVMLKL